MGELNRCMVKGEGLRKALDQVYAYASNIVEKRIMELESKEVELKDRSFALEERAKKVEEAEARLVDIERKSDGFRVEVEAKRKELNFIKNQVESSRSESNAEEAKLSELRRLVEECEAEKTSKESELSEMMESCRQTQLELERYHVQVSAEMESLRKLDEEAERKLKDLTLVQDKIEGCEKMFETRSSELVSKEKELEELSQKIYLREQMVMSLNKDVMEDCQRMNTKRKELEDVQKLIEERKTHCESLKLLIEEHSEEIVSKVKQQDEITEAIRNSNEELNSVKEMIEESLKQFQSKEEEQVRLKASLMEREQGLALKEKELGDREERINKKDQKLKPKEKKLARSSKKTQLKAKNLCSFCQQQLNSDQHVDLVRDAKVFDEKTLQLLLRGHLKKRDQLHLDVLSSLKRSWDPAKLVLDTISGLYSAHQRTSVKNLDPNSVQRSSIFLLECLMDMAPKPTAEVQGEAIKFATEWRNTSLVKAENPVEVLEFLHFLASFSLAYTFDADQVQSIFDVAFLRKYGPSLCKALGVSALAPVNNVLSLDDKADQHSPEAPIINSSDPSSSDVQQSIASSLLPNGDALRDFEGSTSFLPKEDPGRFVLTSVENALMKAHGRGRLSLEDPILMTLVPPLEELARVVISTDPDLQSEATRVAQKWGGMMGGSVKKSQLEVWAFLQFIVAFGLVKQTQQDETLQFASHVSYFRHAPKLFESLGLRHAIPNLVIELLKKGLYIQAIRFMFFFKVENNFSPLEFLKEQIINLRRSSKENTRHESQAEEANRNAATVRDIMELIEDFKLEIDIPADLILKFMVPTSSPPVKSTRMQASHTFIQRSCIATHGSNPSLPTSFGAEPSALLQGQHSHHAGAKRPRVDPRPVIRPCFSTPPGFGRF